MKKILLAGLLLSGTITLNAQITSAVESSTKTGYGLLNGALNASGTGGTFLGYRAGAANTGNYNSFIGYYSGNSNVSGTANTFTGYYSGYANTASNNSFYGYSAGRLNTTGTQNTFFGAYTGYNNSTGTNNAFFGRNAGYTTTLGGDNVFVGSHSGYLNTTGSTNIFMGTRTGYNNTSGQANIFVGQETGLANTTGSYNVYLGFQAGLNNTSADGGNVFIGHASGQTNASGSGNTYVGLLSGQNSTGSHNVFIGNSAGISETRSQKLHIKNGVATTPLIYGEFDSGKVSIGGMTTLPTTAGGVNISAYKLFVKGGILTEEVRINLQSDWADYVFAKEYKLAPLSQVEKFIVDNGHLPNVPSAAQVKEEGIAVGQMATIQQEKIEELTLYIIQQQKEIDELKAAVKTLMAKQ